MRQSPAKVFGGPEIHSLHLSVVDSPVIRLTPTPKPSWHIDNLFLVESPLQALVAVELSLSLGDQVNGLIYRLAPPVRRRNNEQLLKVIQFGDWFFQEAIEIPDTSGLSYHLEFRKRISKVRDQLRGSVRNVFFGEFRSHWMHLVRMGVEPKKFILMDDGAVTLTIKNDYIDQGVYYPHQLFKGKNPLSNLTKGAIYFNAFKNHQARRAILTASAFLGAEADYSVDFSAIREKIGNQRPVKSEAKKKALYFGSKYSEAGIISRSYELYFLTEIARYYETKGLDWVYCAHRDESDSKLMQIADILAVKVVKPDLPAEVFVLEEIERIAEIGAAYSSVVKNLSLMFPDKPITSFQLDNDALRESNRRSILEIYRYFRREGITVLTV